jgi:hypothetical protein
MVETAVDAVEWRSRTVWLETPLVINVAKFPDKTSIRFRDDQQSYNDRGSGHGSWIGRVRLVLLNDPEVARPTVHH